MHQAVAVEVLQHALHGQPVDPEGDGGRHKVQATTDHVLVSQQVREGRTHPATDTTCTVHHGGSRGLRQLLNILLMIVSKSQSLDVSLPYLNFDITLKLRFSNVEWSVRM